MNAAARLVHQHSLTRQIALTYLLDRWQMMILMCTVGVIMSALTIIYITHHQRLLNADYQRALITHDQLLIKRSQLLLEKSTQLMQTEVEQTAETKLQMHVPSQHAVVVIKE